MKAGDTRLYDCGGLQMSLSEIELQVSHARHEKNPGQTILS